MKSIRLLVVSALALTVFSHSALASFVCQEKYEQKLNRFEENRSMRNFGKVGMIFGFILPAGVAGAFGGAVTMGFAGMMIGGVAAGSGAGHLAFEVIDRENTLTSTYEVFKLAELTREEAFLEWQKSGLFQETFRSIRSNKESFNVYLRIANQTSFNGRTWDAESFRAFAQNPVATDPDNIFGYKYSNAIDLLVEKAVKKKDKAISYDEVRAELSRIADGEACSKKSLMGFSKMKKTLLETL